MPATDIGTVEVYAGLTEDLIWTTLLFEADGATPAKLASEDVLHFVLSERIRGEPGAVILDIVNTTITVNGSKVFIDSLGTVEPHAAASGSVRLAQADTDAIVDTWDEDIRSQWYVAEMYYLDDSETNPADAKKLMARGVVHLHRSGAQT